MESRLLQFQEKSLIIQAKEYLSSEYVSVLPGEIYEISCNENERWKDWFIKSKSTGYTNIFARLIGLRLRNVKCFTLCGIYNSDESTAFPIGSYVKINTNQISGSLYFFANDVKGFYFNNKGCIKIKIKRLGNNI